MVKYGKLEEAMVWLAWSIFMREFLRPCKIRHFSGRSKWKRKQLLFGKDKVGEKREREKKWKWRALEENYNCLIRQWPINHPLLWLWQTFSTTTQWKTKKQKGAIAAHGPRDALLPGDPVFCLALVMAMTCRCRVWRHCSGASGDRAGVCRGDTALHGHSG